MQLLVIFFICLVISSTVYWVVTHFWMWLLPIGGLLLMLRLAWPWIRYRLELQQVRMQKASAMHRVDDIQQKALNDIENVARQHEAGGEPPSTPNK